MCKFIFVSGGVVSGLGKGITMAAIGRSLKNRNVAVSAIKMDPYMNVDPGTMSPFQHGEVFVTADGGETDLDLGHYERFMDVELNQYSNITSGSVYWDVLQQERNGDYLGSTVQVIPHITNKIKERLYLAAQKSQCDVLLCEIGGTVGDIESQPFLEAVRQVIQEKGKDNCLFLHVTLVPYLSMGGEYKSKPTQHSVKQLQSYGIMPDLIIARSDEQLPDDILAKISLFCNIEKECVISNYNVASLYDVVFMLEKANIADLIAKKLHLTLAENNDQDWQLMSQKAKSCDKEVDIALIGKYVKLHDAYLSIVESLHHACIQNQAKLNIHWIDSERLENENVAAILHDCDGIIIPGGFGHRGIEGKIQAAQYAREQRIPYFGICLGMQIASIEFARNVLGYQDANSKEFNAHCEHAIIDLMREQEVDGQKGGTMRLGNYPCDIAPHTKLYEIYKQDSILERHRHRYEFNQKYEQEYIKNGFVFAGRGKYNQLVEAIELADHPFFIGVQYHPEFKSRPNNAHPLFVQFIAQALNHQR